MKVVGIVLLTLGIIISLIAFPMKIMHWPFALQAFIVGPVFIFTGISFLLVYKFKKTH